MTDRPNDIKPTHARRQHDALSTLVVLSNQCAQAEYDIQSRHARTHEAIETPHKKLTEFITDRYGVRSRRSRRELEEQIALATQQAAIDREQLTTSAKDRLESLIHKLESTRTKTREDYQHARWTADSMLEGVLVKIKKDKQQALKEAEAHAASVEELIARCMRRLTKYGMGGQELPRPAPTVPDTPGDTDPTPAFEAVREEAKQRVEKLESLPIPSALIGIKPYAFGVLLAVLAAIVAHITSGNAQPNLLLISGTVAGALLIYSGIVFLLKKIARRQVLQALNPFAQSVADAKAQTDRVLAFYAIKRKADRVRANQQRDASIEQARAEYEPRLEELKTQNQQAIAAAKQQAEQSVIDRQTDAEQLIARLTEQRDTEVQHNHDKRHRLLEQAEARYKQRHADNDRRRVDGLAELESRWTRGRERIEAEIGRLTAVNAERFPPWGDASWDSWSPPQAFSDVVRFGQLDIDMGGIMTDLARGGRFTLDLPDAFAVPALLSAPDQRSVLVQAGLEGRDDAIRTIQAVMARILTAMPPGRVKFTLVDPVGLGQSFAGFMHLADHDESLVTSRIWSEPQHINARLADLTEHMENVIQKYLRNDFETIGQYNAQAGELAEPYRFLVISDFPNGFSQDAITRLASIAASGARCGVFLLIFHDVRQPMPSGTHIEDLKANCVTVTHSDGRWVWNDSLYERFHLTLDRPPTEALLTRIVNAVGSAARDASCVEVPFEVIAPREDQRWTRSTVDELAVPVGRTGATRLQSVTLGHGVAQHALVVGKTGSGKSTLLHVLITNLALWHHPDEVEFYLIDFKKGVEFKSYADLGLPHARAIAIESDREFGLSVLQRLDAELERRGELFRKHGVQNLAGYRALPDRQPLPRNLLLIDEFHEFFAEDDKIAQDAALLLDRLVRQGRAFGVHAFLGSQSLGGALGLGRGTLGQMAVRIALQCSEADSQLILHDDNAAARLLTRPGEAIYNDQGGALEGNSPFQISWLSETLRDQMVRATAELAKQHHVKRPPTIVFEGNAPADLGKNQPLAALLDRGKPADAPATPLAWIGEPVAIKDPTALQLRRQAGANALIIGQQDEAAMAMLGASILALAAQIPQDQAAFHLFDGSSADAPMHGRFASFADAIPHPAHLVAWRDTDDAIAQLAAEVQRRIDGDADPEALPSQYILIYGLQRYRSLRKSEDDFSFSMDDAPATPKPDKQFTEILKEGPAVGVHVIAWCDTPISVDRVIDRGLMREFDYRVLFQMSATDSSNLIDTPAANTLGLYRALCYSEERGTLEKFRPYALPDAAMLQRVREVLG